MPRVHQHETRCSELLAVSLIFGCLNPHAPNCQRAEIVFLFDLLRAVERGQNEFKIREHPDLNVICFLSRPVPDAPVIPLDDAAAARLGPLHILAGP